MQSMIAADSATVNAVTIETHTDYSVDCCLMFNRPVSFHSDNRAGWIRHRPLWIGESMIDYYGENSAAETAVKMLTVGFISVTPEFLQHSYIQQNLPEFTRTVRMILRKDALSDAAALPDAQLQDGQCSGCHDMWPP